MVVMSVLSLAFIHNNTPIHINMVQYGTAGVHKWRSLTGYRINVYLAGTVYL